MHFADPALLKAAGVVDPDTADDPPPPGTPGCCHKCHARTRAARRCDEDIWDHKLSAVFPIKVSPHSDGIPFCPAKLRRDDPELSTELRHHYLAWRLGQVPFGDSLDTMSVEQAEILTTLISTWERLARAEDFRRLASLFGAK